MGVTCDLQCLFSNSDELFPSKVMCENLVWIGRNRKYVNYQGGQKPPIKGGYMWPAMPIFEHGWAFSLKSHVWKFGPDWLSLSRVILSTNKHSLHPKKKKITDVTENNILGKILFRRIKTRKASRLWTARRGLTIIESIWKSGNLPYLVANSLHMLYISSKSEVFDFTGGQKPPIRVAYSNRKKLKLWESALYSG